MKFQQVTAAVMAKGVEDTAFYRYNRLVSLNEVGGSPAKFGVGVDEFHRVNLERLQTFPHSMLSSSTHDSKRSEDVRARIDVLSEIPAAWRLQLRRWHQWNRSRKRVIEDQIAPTSNDEYLLYQTLIGMWPQSSPDEAGWREFSERIEQYMLKAVREAKEHTSWANTNEEYESALLSFTRAILQRSPKNRFLNDFAEFQRRIAHIGIFNSLSQCLLKLTAPGVPDMYQGNEMFQFSLVDPDNRRPIDYNENKALLGRLRSDTHSQSSIERASSLLSSPENGALKLYMTWKTLDLRKREPALFRDGEYKPLTVNGQRPDHVIAFSREYDGQTAIVAVPRLCAALLGENLDTVCNEELWGDTHVEITNLAPAECYHNVFTGECVQPNSDPQQRGIGVAKLLSHFPVALLMSAPSRCE
jgi:malto-oligosyltrehalose synthase